MAMYKDARTDVKTAEGNSKSSNGDMISSNGGAEAVVTARMRCAWRKFRVMIPLLTQKSFSVRLKGI